MSLNLLPSHEIEVKNTDKTADDKKRNSKNASKNWQVGDVVSLLFLLCGQVVIIILVVQLHFEVDELERSNLAKLQLKADQAKQHLNDVGVFRQREKRGTNLARNEEFDKLKGNIMSYFQFLHASAHLCLNENYTRRMNEHFDSNFRWSGGRSHCSGTSNINHDNLELRTAHSSGLELSRTGHYFIYLQMTVNGTDPQAARTNPHCVFFIEVERINHKRARLQLLTLQITQRSITNRISAYTSGVFSLDAGDHLKVRPDSTTRFCKVLTYREQSFLGLYYLSASG